jgi:hypothetical protein
MKFPSASWFSIEMGRERAERCKELRVHFETTPEHYLFITSELIAAHDKLKKIRELAEDG